MIENGHRARPIGPSGLALFWDNVKTLIYAVGIALVVRTLAFEPFNIPSGSMIPSLLVGDYLFVSKYTYGYSRHSLPFGLPLFQGRIAGRYPARGDVAVFKLPRDNKTDYIKRVIGLPGDRIQVKGGILHINGMAVERRKIDDYILLEANGMVSRKAQYVEKMPGPDGRSHLIIESSDNAGGDNTQEYVVPAEHFFMMGDNRDNSLDSRVPPGMGGVGFVPFENLVGRAEFLFASVDVDQPGIYVPFLDDTRLTLLELWNWRFKRLFRGIE